MVENVDRRVLGAVQLNDGVTGARIARPLSVTGDGLDIRRNRSGLYVIFAATGLETHTASFEAPPAAPPAESQPFNVVVTDPRRDFVPTLAVIDLPRPFDPGSGITDLMEPIEIVLPSSPTRAASPSWAQLRALVLDTGGAPVRGALVEVQPSGGGDPLGWGITNAHGETLVAVPGLPALTEIENDPLDEEDDEIATAETAADVSAVADPAQPWPVNPVTLAAGGAELRTSAVVPVSLSPGRIGTATLEVDLT